jgi:rhodanese-related sulfurtransferase
MKLSISQWSLPGKLALVALALGALAVFGDPYGGGAVTLHPRELAVMVQKEIDHVAVEELAGWIIQGRSDYRLIDLRDAGSWAAYHIPTAENIPITALPGDTLARNEKIVLYSDGGIHSAQAWFLLAAQGYKGVYILRGGLDEWNARILSKTAMAPPAAPGSAVPKAQAPSPPRAPAAPATAPKKKRKEGC